MKHLVVVRFDCSERFQRVMEALIRLLMLLAALLL